MKKAKITLLALVIAVLSVCCFAFIACGSDEVTDGHTVTWTVNENLNVAVQGYNKLPEKVADGTVLTFTVTPKVEGWEVTSVQPLANVKKQSDGSYQATITKDLEIRINAREIVESFSVTKPEGGLTYYAGDKFLTEKNGAYEMPEGFKIKANFKTGNMKDLTASDFTVEYATDGAEAFALGDTSFKISYGGAKETINLTGAVRGRISLNLGSGGKWGAEALAALNTKFGDKNIDVKTEEKGDNEKKKTNVCYILFDNAFEEDYTLPNPIQTFTNKAGTSTDFDFKQWNGIVNGKIAKDTAVSLEAEAIYNVELVDFYSLHFITKDVMDTVKETVDGKEVEKQVEAKNVPFFVIEGKFVAADSAQLILKEGNEPVTQLFGTKIEISENTDEFSLEFDLRQFVRWTNPDTSATKKQTLINSWNDIRFRAELNDEEYDQIIDLNDYPEDFVDLGDTLEAEVDGNKYQFAYQVWTGSGSIGKDLKLYYQNCPDVVAKKVTLVNHEFAGEDDQKVTLPAISVSVVDFTATSQEALTAIAENYLSNPQVLDSWRGVNMKKDYTVDFANHIFTLYLSVDDVKQGEEVFFHMKGGGDNFYNCSIGNALLDSSDPAMKYRLRLYSGAVGDSVAWKNGLVIVEYIDPVLAALKVTSETATIKIVGEGEAQKAVLEVKGTVETEHYTKAEIEQFHLNTDLQGNMNEGGANWNTVADLPVTLTVDDELNFTVTIDLTNVPDGKYTVHCAPFATELTGGATDLKPTMDAVEPVVITIGNKKITMIYDKAAYYGCVGIIVETVETAA